MTLKRPLLMQAAGGDTAVEYSALDVRALLGMLLRNEGVLHALPPGASALKVTQRAAGANFSVDVDTGAAVIAGDDITDQGMYAVQSTAATNLAVASPPVSGTRIHRVVARVKDHLHDGSWAVNTYEWALEVLEDTGSGTPATPASAISLATVSVAAAQSSVLAANITDTRVVALLGPSRRSLVNATTLPANPGAGEEVWRTDTRTVQFWDSSVSAWLEMFRAGAWTTYTPVLTASSVNPTLGTGSVVDGSWVRDGRKVTVHVGVAFGSSGAAAGTGTYRISLPVTAKTLTTGFHIGGAFGNDLSAADGVDGVSRIGASGGWDKVEMMLNNALATAAVPWTWANGDTFSLTITYEAAS